jgi:hypothetical protein
MKKRIYTQEEIDDCKKFYIEQEGKDLNLIVDKMKAKGWDNFNDRVFYTRQRRGGYEPGWAERFGWNEELEAMGIPVRKNQNPSGTIFRRGSKTNFPIGNGDGNIKSTFTNDWPRSPAEDAGG